MRNSSVIVGRPKIVWTMTIVASDWPETDEGEDAHQRIDEDLVGDKGDDHHCAPNRMPAPRTRQKDRAYPVSDPIRIDTITEGTRIVTELKKPTLMPLQLRPVQAAGPRLDPWLESSGQ